jgi:hypothetical protein
MTDKAYILRPNGGKLMNKGDGHDMGIKKGKVYPTKEQRLALDLAIQKLGWKPLNWNEDGSLSLGGKVVASFIDLNHEDPAKSDHYVEIQYTNKFKADELWEMIEVSSASGNPPHTYTYSLEEEDNSYFCFMLNEAKDGLVHNPVWDSCSTDETIEEYGVAVDTDMGSEDTLKVAAKAAKKLIS